MWKLSLKESNYFLESNLLLTKSANCSLEQADLKNSWASKSWNSARSSGATSTHLERILLKLSVQAAGSFREGELHMVKIKLKLF